MADRIVTWGGRFLLSLVFLASAAGKLANFSGTAAFMAAKGMPFAELFLVGAIVLELAGGLSLLTGYRPELGAAALVVFLVPATLIFHDFWRVAGAAQQAELVNFLKNLSILGGIVLVGFAPRLSRQPVLGR